MNRLTLCIILIICFIYHYVVCQIILEPNPSIRSYEFGAHVNGEHKSYEFVGVAPHFKQYYSMNITPEREDLEKRFTYLRVEYYNHLSAVNVTFDEDKLILLFYTKYPFSFAETKIGIIGYSLPLDFKHG